MGREIYIYEDTPDISEHQRILQNLTRKHAIWIRDVHHKDGQFQSIPWPQANLMGKCFPMCEFMMVFNKKFADENFQNAQKMDHNMLDILLKDYFVEGSEGFNFPIDEEILISEDKFKACLHELYEKFPHLKPKKIHDWILTLIKTEGTDVHAKVIDHIKWEGEKTDLITKQCLQSGDQGYRELQEFLEVPSLSDVQTTELTGPGWYRVFAAYGDKTAVLYARENVKEE